ncbi:MAG: ParB/RepB/Spo0J family partition protein [Flavobacteriaceae bacterium]|nr:ParB/RepB/Spo0J family partition protein [Flavobacteriaceae bacterium]
MGQSSKKQALGRGLSTLLNDNSKDLSDIKSNLKTSSVGNIIKIPVNLISSNPFQPRSYFNEERINELASSISELGLIQPITVRKIDENSFQLVSGERRLRATKLIGLETIPCYIRSINDQESLEMALVENIQRQDLDPIEIALSYKRLIEEIQLTQNELSDRVGKKRSTITNYLRLLKLDPIVQTGIRDGFISMGHGRALISIDNSKNQIKLYEKILKKGLSVRNTEEIVTRLKVNTEIELNKHIPKFTLITANDLQSLLETKVKVKVNNNGKGVLTISFNSQEDLNRIVNKINKGA